MTENRHWALRRLLGWPMSRRAMFGCRCNALVAGWVLFAVSLHFPAPVLAKVTFEGVGGSMAEAVEQQVSLASQVCELNRAVVRYQFSRIQAEVAAALQTFGYYSPTVSTSLVFEADCWQASVVIEPGAPVLIRRSQFEVTPPAATFDALDTAAIAPGQPFDHVRYESFKASAEQRALEKGYFNARFVEHKVTVEPQSYHADIQLLWQPGPRFTLGKPLYEDATLNASLLDRYLAFAPGDPYDASLLGETYQALLGSEYFEDVSITADPDSAEAGEIPVRINLIPTTPRATRLGVGYSTDIGAKGSVRHTNKRVNRRGHRAEGLLSVAEREAEIGATYRIPHADHLSGWTSIYGGVRKADTLTSLSTSSKVGIRELVPLGRNWVMTRFVEIVNDEFLIAEDREISTNLVPGLSFSRTKSNLKRRPLGYTINVGLSGTSRSIGSDTDFVNLFASGKWILPLWKGGRIIGRGQAAAVISDEFDELTPGNRYFSGGDNKVRGFDFNTLGPRDEDGDVIGGNRLMEASLEIDQSITDDWALAVFMDAGSAALDKFGETFDASIGFGVRWYSPVGPVQVDVATPLDGGGVRLHLSLGPDL